MSVFEPQPNQIVANRFLYEWNMEEGFHAIALQYRANQGETWVVQRSDRVERIKIKKDAVQGVRDAIPPNFKSLASWGGRSKEYPLPPLFTAVLAPVPTFYEMFSRFTDSDINELQNLHKKLDEIDNHDLWVVAVSYKESFAVDYFDGLHEVATKPYYSVLGRGGYSKMVNCICFESEEDAKAAYILIQRKIGGADSVSHGMFHLKDSYL